MKARFILNPRSGRNSRRPCLIEITQAFIRENGLNASVALTERPKHATELARRAVDESCDLVVAIGGDGTLNEVASALIGSETTLGLVPRGSGNGLGRHLGIFRERKTAFATLLRGQARAIDTGSVNGIPFFNVMGLGFDAEIGARFNELTRRGPPAYVRATIAEFLHYQGERVTIRGPNGSMETPAFLVAIANSDQYGNNCYIAPGASVDDGQLDLTVLTHVSLLNALPLAARLFSKSIDRSSSVLRQRAAHFTLTRASPGLIHTDGEIHRVDATLEIAVRPRSLRIMTPRDSQ